jgi:hypothetical protein
MMLNFLKYSNRELARNTTKILLTFTMECLHENNIKILFKYVVCITFLHAQQIRNLRKVIKNFQKNYSLTHRLQYIIYNF